MSSLLGRPDQLEVDLPRNGGHLWFRLVDQREASDALIDRGQERDRFGRDNGFYALTGKSAVPAGQDRSQLVRSPRRRPGPSTL